MINPRVGLFITGLAAAFMVAVGSPAHSGAWFTHKFGELRAYHGHWLNVCRDNGKGACRTVQLPLEPGATETFFANRRFSVHMNETGAWMMEVYQVSMPRPAGTPLIIKIDGEAFKLGTDDWKTTNLLESFQIVSKPLIEKLIPAMKRGNVMTVNYSDEGGARKTAHFTLLGFTAATNAIENHLKNRN